MRTRSAVILALVAVLAIGSAAPASAQKERFEEPEWGLIWHDPDLHLAQFFNVTRDGFCAWEENDFEGPFPAVQPVILQETVNSRNWTFKARVQVPIELWSTPPEGGVGVCEDTASQPGPWATGTARVNLTYRETGNGWFYDDSFTATVTDSEGAPWIYKGSYRESCTWERECTFIVTGPGGLEPG